MCQKKRGVYELKKNEPGPGPGPANDWTGRGGPGPGPEKMPRTWPGPDFGQSRPGMTPPDPTSEILVLSLPSSCQLVGVAMG